jgi:hypothetical protein
MSDHRPHFNTLLCHDVRAVCTTPPPLACARHAELQVLTRLLVLQARQLRLPISPSTIGKSNRLNLSKFIMQTSCFVVSSTTGASLTVVSPDLLRSLSLFEYSSHFSSTCLVMDSMETRKSDSVCRSLSLANTVRLEISL